MTTITKKNNITEKLVTGFDLQKNNFFGDRSVREKAMESFLRQGIPSRRSEEYKYLNIDLLLREDFSLAEGAYVSADEIGKAKLFSDAFLVVIVNGCFSLEHSSLGKLPPGLVISDIRETSSDAAFQQHYAKHPDIQSDPFAALNTAYANGGVFIHVAKNTIVGKPIHILHCSSGNENTLMHSRNLFVIEENAEVQLIESFNTLGKAKIFTNALAEISIADSARVEHNKIQVEGENGNLMNSTVVCQAARSVFTTNNFTLSGAFVRNNLTILLDAENIETHLNGLYLTRGNQMVDNHTLVDHRKPNCNSNELYKGIIEDKSTATFNGKIFVRKDAQKTNAFQSNKNILLSDDGTINTKPQLEIYADDVKCSHGTSTGKLDEEKIFYLRSRGLSESSAKKLLMHAFASEVVEKISLPELRLFVEQKITERFQ
jgi:Fe-S cluster assembly protein SufD